VRISFQRGCKWRFPNEDFLPTALSKALFLIRPLENRERPNEHDLLDRITWLPSTWATIQKTTHNLDKCVFFFLKLSYINLARVSYDFRYRLKKKSISSLWSNGAFLCLWERSKRGIECSPKLEVLQDSAFETNEGYEISFLTECLSIDLVFLIRCSLHFSFIRLSPIVLYPLKSDAVWLIVTVEKRS